MTPPPPANRSLRQKYTCIQNMLTALRRMLEDKTPTLMSRLIGGGTWQADKAPPAMLFCILCTAPLSTYINRVQSSVWRLPNYSHLPPSPPSECVLLPHQKPGGEGGGGTHSPGGEGVEGQYFGRRQTLGGSYSMILLRAAHIRPPQEDDIARLPKFLPLRLQSKLRIMGKFLTW
jgi:hypothetical protein